MANAQAALEKEEGSLEALNWLRTPPAVDPYNKKAQAMVQAVEAGASKRLGVSAPAAAFRTPITIEFKDAPIKVVFS